MLFEIYGGISFLQKRKKICNLMQLGNVVIPMDSEVSFVDDLGQSQPPNQAMAEKVMSKDNDQHCIGQGQTNGTPPSLVFHYLWLLNLQELHKLGWQGFSQLPWRIAHQILAGKECRCQQSNAADQSHRALQAETFHQTRGRRRCLPTDHTTRSRRWRSFGVMELPSAWFGLIQETEGIGQAPKATEVLCQGRHQQNHRGQVTWISSSEHVKMYENIKVQGQLNLFFLIMK